MFRSLFLLFIYENLGVYFNVNKFKMEKETEREEKSHKTVEIKIQTPPHDMSSEIQTPERILQV